MAKTIQGVPETVTREQLCAFLSNFGFTPANLLSLRIDPAGISAEVFERNEDGGKELNTDGSGFMKHTVRIPIEH